MTPREAGEAAFYECEGNNEACLKAAFDAYESTTNSVIEAFMRPGMMVFLDGRNEYGSHVLPALPANMEDGNEDELAESAEEILQAAEGLGFSVGDLVWTEWRWNPPQIGDVGRVEFPGYWEFVRVNPAVSRAIVCSKAKEA